MIVPEKKPPENKKKRGRPKGDWLDGELAERKRDQKRKYKAKKREEKAKAKVKEPQKVKKVKHPRQTWSQKATISKCDLENAAIVDKEMTPIWNSKSIPIPKRSPSTKLYFDLKIYKKWDTNKPIDKKPPRNKCWVTTPNGPYAMYETTQVWEDFKA